MPPITSFPRLPPVPNQTGRSIEAVWGGLERVLRTNLGFLLADLGENLMTNALGVHDRIALVDQPQKVIKGAQIGGGQR